MTKMTQEEYDAELKKQQQDPRHNQWGYFGSPKEQLDRIEKKIDALDNKLDKHIEEIWTVYVPIKKLLEKLDKFRLW